MSRIVNVRYYIVTMFSSAAAAAAAAAAGWRCSAVLDGQCNLLVLNLKVSKSRKQILKFSFAPKNNRKCFCISALASKKRSNQKHKGTLYH